MVGRHVVAALERRGHAPVVLARSHGVDLVTGAGLAEALDGVQAVIDVSNRETLSGRRAARFFGTATAQLLDAGRDAGVEHHVVLSIVGVDRVRTGYYAAKLAQERLVQQHSVPSTVLRTTQFHEFAGQVLAQGRGPVALVPRMRVRPVAAAEVGDRLAELAVGAPLGVAPELAGPEEHDLVDLARRVAASQDRRVLPVRLPGAGWRAMARGALLPSGQPVTGSTTFDEWWTATRPG